MGSTTRMASAATPAARKKDSEYPPSSLSEPVTPVASTRPTEPPKESMALARTASWGGNRLLNTATSTTQVPAASPVTARPTINPFTPAARPMVNAPSPTRTRPPTMNGLRHPSQSATMPSGSRMTACHRPYWDRTTPTSARLSLFVCTYVGSVGTYRYSPIQYRNTATVYSPIVSRRLPAPATERAALTPGISPISSQSPSPRHLPHASRFTDHASRLAHHASRFTPHASSSHFDHGLDHPIL